MIIRTATTKDAASVQKIYAPYVTDTAITFESEVPSAAAFEDRIRTIGKEYPFLIAEVDGEVVGYAYATLFHAREAYRHSAETSIYLKEGWKGKGLGRQLYEALEALLLRQGVYVLYACITATDRKDDAYLSDASIHFHSRMGYRLIGRHDLCGYKFDQWYSVVWMEKVLAERPLHPESFVPYPQIQ